jgi:hypothetical protein
LGGDLGLLNNNLTNRDLPIMKLILSEIRS